MRKRLKSFYSRVTSQLGFSPQERKALAGICLFIILGACLRYYQNSELSSSLVLETVEKTLPTHKEVDSLKLKLDLNSCTMEDLMELPGIGEVKARAILEFRDKEKFRSVEDVCLVSGIGLKIFESIRNDIYVSPE